MRNGETRCLGPKRRRDVWRLVAWKFVSYIQYDYFSGRDELRLAFIPCVSLFVHVFLVVRSYSLHVSNCVTDCATSFPPLSWPRRKVQCKHGCLRCSLLGVDWINEIFIASFTTMWIEATMMCSRRLDDRAYVLFFSIPLSVGLTWHGSCW